MSTYSWYLAAAALSEGLNKELLYFFWQRLYRCHIYPELDGISLSYDYNICIEGYSAAVNAMIQARHRG